MGEVSVTVIDLAIAGVILVSAIYGAVRGLMRETLSIFSWAAAAYVALRFFSDFSPMVRESIQPDWLADLTTFAGTFIIVLVPLSYMSVRFSDTVKRTEIGPVDRSLGFVFGVGRGLVVVGLAYIVFSLLVPPANQPQWLIQARLFPVLENTSDVLLSLVPPPEEFPTEDIFTRATSGTGETPEPTRQAAENPPPDDEAPTYGAEERAALDRLIESAGGP
jgi:membrane protein required for colicin V production